jgi:hypothetical protein
MWIQHTHGGSTKIQHGHANAARIYSSWSSHRRAHSVCNHDHFYWIYRDLGSSNTASFSIATFIHLLTNRFEIG